MKLGVRQVFHYQAFGYVCEHAISVAGSSQGINHPTITMMDDDTQKKDEETEGEGAAEGEETTEETSEEEEAM